MSWIRSLTRRAPALEPVSPPWSEVTRRLELAAKRTRFETSALSRDGTELAIRVRDNAARGRAALEGK